MKILYITNDLSGIDGWSRCGIDLINEVRKCGHDVLCVVNKENSQNKIPEKVLLSAALNYLYNPIRNFIDGRKINKLISEFKPDIVHIIVEPYVHLFSLLKLDHAKLFLTVHGTYSFIPNLIKNRYKRVLANYLSNRTYNQMDCIIAVSNFTKNYLLKNLNSVAGLEEKIKVINNGVCIKDDSLISAKTNKVSKILFVGAIKSRKGLLEAIDALKLYRNNFSGNFVFNIIGDYNQKDPYYEMLLKKIKEYHLESMVFFRGKVDQQELENYYNEADLFLMISVNKNFQFEGFGLTYLEANIKGVPCIGSINCGAEDAIINNKTGYLVNPDNKVEVAEKIKLILDNKSINPKDCIDWARKNSVENKAKDIMELYKTTINV